MLRTTLSDTLKYAMLAKNTRTVSTVRLILAALKDRDIAARGHGNAEGIGETEILQMLQGMVKQRRDSIALYEQGNRFDLVSQEREEISVIERFLPRRLDESEMTTAIDTIIGDLGAQGLKDMGRIMSALRTRHAGQMDFAQASTLVKKRLSP